MAKTRVHELAKQYGVESKVILEKLKEMGEFVKSASSQIEPDVEMRFKAAWKAQSFGALTPKERAARAGRRRGRLPEPRRLRHTSWDDSSFDEGARRVWERYGLGENDADLAMYLLERGLMPEDLQLLLRGRTAVRRLRGGEESRAVLAAEMLEVRSRVEVPKRPLPSTAVTRRRKAS